MRRWNVLFSCGLILVCGFKPPECLAAPRKSEVARQSRTDTLHAEPRTTLRAGQPVVVTSTGRRGREIRHLNVDVRNVGRAVATDVMVIAELGGGVVYPLTGPRRIAPGQSGVYILRSGVPLAGRGPIRVKPGCSNCRR